MVTGDEATAAKQILHPAYTVTNINKKIRTLGGKKVTYSSWVKLFHLHARAYKVSHHIDGTAAPAQTDPNYAIWFEIDALVLQWIYSTLSDDLLSRVLSTDITARQAWIKIQEILINNKQARAVTLETRFTNTTLNSCTSFNDYCHTYKEIAEQLSDVDQPVTESRLVIQMVRGLPVEYDTIAALINQQKPAWEEARNMIEDEQSRLAARSQHSRDNTNRDNVLIHTNNTSNTNRSPYPNGYKGKNYDPIKAAKGRGAPNRGGPNDNQHKNEPPQNRNYGQGNTRQTGQWINQTYPNQKSQQWHTQQPNQYQYTWNPPPTPYPSRPNGYNQTQQYPAQQQAHIAQQHPQDHYSQPGNTLCPSDIGAALTNMTLNYPDPQWHMDSGASSHITSNQGPQGWTPPFPSQ